jgi:hypothetical protein
MKLARYIGIGTAGVIGLFALTTAAVAIIQPKSEGVFATSMQHETLINAPPEVVWAILSDFKAFPEWNPFVVKIEGPMTVGARIKVAVQAPPGAEPMKFEPIVLIVDPNKEFKWRGKFLAPGLFDGTHSFKLMATPDGGTQFIHGESFAGVIVPIFRGKMAADTALGFKAMDTAIKARAEKMALVQDTKSEK